MAVSTAIPGTCFICQQTVPGDRIRRHLLDCIESRTGLKPSPNPRRRDPRRTAWKTACLSIRARERPRWLELGVRCDTTLHELDRFLRGVSLECCGHLSHFEIGDDIYSLAVRAHGRTGSPVVAHGEDHQCGHTPARQIRVRARLRQSHRADSRTPRRLRGAGAGGQPFAAVARREIVILARNNPLQACLRCGGPANWRVAPEYDEFEEYDEGLYDDEGILSLDDLDPITFCEECAPAAGDLVPLPNSPRVGVNCYDNIYSRGSWPLADSDEDEW